MGFTGDCSAKLSGEHIISRAVINLVGPKEVRIGGAPWLSASETKIVSTNSLVSNVLCTRHNSAMSSLDDAAGKFFSSLRLIYDDLRDRKTLSRKRLWFLQSGEELELWMFKTALNMFHSGTLAIDRVKMRDRQDLDEMVAGALVGHPIAHPCGLTLHQEVPEESGRDSFDLTAMMDDAHERMVGLRFHFMGVALVALLEPRAHYGNAVLDTHIHRPTYLWFRGRIRQHVVILTWPGIQHKEAAIFLESKL